MANKPTLITDKVINAYLQAGIDPRTGQPTRCGTPRRGLKDSIKMQLRLIDEQDAVNRFIWYNLPLDISSQELERLLYYKGNLCFFYFTELNKFVVMPYALDGTIDFYGRFNTVHPVPFATGESETEKKLYKNQAEVLSEKHLKVLYEVPTEPLEGGPGDYCVLLYDYTKQMSETIIPRQQVQDGLLDVMADCIPFMRTALLNSTGVQGMRVNSADECSNVAAANRSIDSAGLNGDKWVAIEGATEFQELTGGATSKGEEFLMAMQSLDNFRLSTYGLENGGLFEKKQYQNTAQTMMNGSGQVGRPLQDSLTQRQHACDIINSVWLVGMSCELTETASGMDLNMDGVTADSQDQSGMHGEQPQGGDANGDV